MRGLFRVVAALRRLTGPALNKARSYLCVVGNVLGFSGVFDFHISEFLGIENLATLQALDKLGVFLPGDDSYFGMSAGRCHRSFCLLD